MSKHIFIQILFVALSFYPNLFSNESISELYAIIDLPGGKIDYMSNAPVDLLKNDIYRTDKIVLRRIPSGRFTMGSLASEERRPLIDETRHEVTITQDYYLGIFEITQGQWRQVMGDKPMGTEEETKTRPVVNVTWDDCQDFIAKLNDKIKGSIVRLPTEAEWEYACRAGTNSTFSGTGILMDMGWYKQNCNSTQVVGMKKPNDWGLYDMHGNVLEWCSDWYGAYPLERVVDPKGAATGTDRVERGGSWYTLSRFCRSADRNMHDPSTGSHHLGARLVLTKPDEIRSK